MKSRVIIAVCLSLGIVVAACHKDSSEVATVSNTSTVPTTTTTKNTSGGHHSAQRLLLPQETTGSTFISTAVANSMISSYLCSINATGNDTDVQSYTINADSLRAYLSDTSVKNVKLMFAHTLGYMAAGYSCQNAGYQSGALTVVVAAYDGLGNYVYHNGMVLEHCLPCPYSCPPGTAGSNTLQ